MLHKRSHVSPRHRRGGMLVLIAITLPLLLFMAAFAINVAWMQLSRTELRTATDAAARAGAKQLSLKQSEVAAREMAKTVALRNKVAGVPLTLADDDIEVGKSTQVGIGRFNFTAGGKKPNAVRVTGNRLSTSKDGAIKLTVRQRFSPSANSRPSNVATASQLDRDICLVVDRSGSMMWTLTSDNYPCGTDECDRPHPTQSRWGSLATSVDAFLDELTTTVQDERVALVSYSSDVTESKKDKPCKVAYSCKIMTRDSDLVSDYGVIRTKMDAISSKPVKGATAISAGLDEGIKVLSGNNTRPFAVKTIILMTDGVHNLGADPVLSAIAAAKQDITIHTITFSDGADIPRMEAVAAAANGKHFHATTQNELTSIFRQIAATLPVLTTE